MTLPRLIINNAPFVTATLHLDGSVKNSLWLTLVRLGSKVNGDLKAFLLQSDQISEGEELMGGSLTVMAFGVKNVNGTNILSSSAHSANHRKITRCRKDSACTKFFFYKNAAKQSGPCDEVENSAGVEGAPFHLGPWSETRQLFCDD